MKKILESFAEDIFDTSLNDYSKTFAYQDARYKELYDISVGEAEGSISEEEAEKIIKGLQRLTSSSRMHVVWNDKMHRWEEHEYNISDLVKDAYYSKLKKKIYTCNNSIVIKRDIAGSSVKGKYRPHKFVIRYKFNRTWDAHILGKFKNITGCQSIVDFFESCFNKGKFDKVDDLFGPRKKINECDGGVCTPISTLSNTAGIGNPTPASMSASSAADQTSSACIGSGDKFGSSSPKQKKGKKVYKMKRKRK